MNHFRRLFLVCLLVATLTITVIGQGKNSTAPPALPSVLRSGEPVVGVPSLSSSDFTARNYITQGQTYITEARLSEAKEALRTAIRLAPMNLEAWALYDHAVELHHVGRAREEKSNPVVERDYKPLFSINRIDSFLEFETLFLIGEIQNVSGSLKRNIEVTGTLLDENKQELRMEKAYLGLKNRGLFPNESSFFEVPFRNPPPGVKYYRVRVSDFE